MTSRQELLQYAAKAYQTEPDYPWRTNPESAVLRHKASGKWFALLMQAPKSSLGQPGEGCADIINLKCDPLLIGSLRREAGVLPAYHMNKEHWITILLESPFPKTRLFELMDLSYELTKKS